MASGFAMGSQDIQQMVSPTWIIGGMATGFVAMAGFIAYLIRSNNEDRKKASQAQNELHAGFNQAMEVVFRKEGLHASRSAINTVG